MYSSFYCVKDGKYWRVLSRDVTRELTHEFAVCKSGFLIFKIMTYFLSLCSDILGCMCVCCYVYIKKLPLIWGYKNILIFSSNCFKYLFKTFIYLECMSFQSTYKCMSFQSYMESQVFQHLYWVAFAFYILWYQVCYIPSVYICVCFLTQNSL